MKPDEKLRARARLALRAEQAFGLKSLPLHAGRCAIGSDRQAVGVSATESDRAAVVVAPVQAVVDLFGTPPTPAGAQVALPTLDALDGSPLSREEKITRLRKLDADEVSICSKCRLCERRTNTV